jgi:hypothetical protein
MLAVAGVWKKKRDDLKTKRNSLFEKYAEHPEEFHLALEIAPNTWSTKDALSGPRHPPKNSTQLRSKKRK